MKLTAADAPALTAAVVAAEAKTSAELVVVVQPKSGTYSDLAWLAGFLASALALITVLFVDLEFDELFVAPVVFGAGVIAFALVALLVPPRRIAGARTK